MKTIKYLLLISIVAQYINSQSIVIGAGSTINVGLGSDICAGEYGNITGNLIGEGTECGNPMSTQTFSLSVDVADGPNMVSIPGLHPMDQNVNTWWPFRAFSTDVMKYANGYQTVTTAAPGTGYWMKHSGDRTYNTGDEWPTGGIQIVSHDPIPVEEGWNLIGGYEDIIATANLTTTPPNQIIGIIFKYSNGYYLTATLEPGYAYWIKLLSACQINLPEGELDIKDVFAKGSGRVKEYFKEDWGRIIFTDAKGISYTLYSAKNEVDLNTYELPPVPPVDLIDIRFGSGRIAEDINSAMKSIEMTGVTYPLTVRVEGMDIRLMDETGKIVNVNLKSGEDILISDAAINKLMVTGDLIPNMYALQQNFPNPFNPSTMIAYSIPKSGFVTIEVYNIIGEEVVTLVNEEKHIGNYQVKFNAVGLPSGIYFYRLQAGDFISTKKMILLK